MRSKPIEQTVIQEHLKKGDSTHGAAPQASAARFILHLRAAYPEISSPVPEVQGSLIHYLDELVQEKPITLSAEEAHHPHIANTVAVIHKIQASSQWTSEEKQKIFAQMRSISATCPGISWDEKHEGWSTNNFYHASHKTMEQVMASPAETLNLVCAAMLDHEHYENKEERDIEFRIESLGNSLLKLRLQEEAGQYEVCAAGRQHELLFLLNHSYLTSDGQVIELIEDSNTFLLDSLSLYIVEQLNHVSVAEKTKIMLDWMHWQHDLNSTEESPLILWLQRRYGDAWLDDCKASLSARCEAFGLEPNHSHIDKILPYISTLSIPSTPGMLIPFMSEIVKAKPLISRTASSGAGMDEQHTILIRYHEALTEMQTAIHDPEFVTRQEASIKDFYLVMMAMKALHHYQQLSIFLGAAEGQFHAAITKLQTELFAYFADFRPEKRLQASFAMHYAEFKEQERQFHKSSQVDFISNFFALINRNNLHTMYARLETLKDPEIPQHPLRLSDEQLTQWYQESVGMTEEGVTTIDISPYQINRIILQVFFTDRETWTPIYLNGLILLSEWLLAPTKPQDSALFQAFKKVYPTHLLQNLWLTALILQNPEFNTPELQTIVTQWDPRSNDFLLFTMMSSPTIPPEQLERLLDTLLSKWNIFIHSSHDLYQLLAFPSLTVAQRAQIFEAMMPRLSLIIHHCHDLRQLLELPPSQLNAAQRTQIFTEMGAKLSTLMRNADEFIDLFSLPLNLFTTEQRTQVFTAIRSKLTAMIKNHDKFFKLLSLSSNQFTAIQRAQVFEILVPQLETLIKNHHELKSLFSLSAEKLNAEQRTLILDKLAPQLKLFINHGYELAELFLLKPAQLSPEQRTLILDKLIQQDVTLIRHGYELAHLFSLDLELLTPEQRVKIFNTLILPIIHDEDELSTLFSLSVNQLNAPQRGQIFDALLPQFIIISSSYRLRSLLSLSLEQLSSAQRTSMLEALIPQLTTLIKNGDDLQYLFSASLEELNAEQRHLILTAVLPQLKKIINSSAALEDLYSSLSLEQLTSAQRTQISNALKNPAASTKLDLESTMVLTPQPPITSSPPITMTLKMQLIAALNNHISQLKTQSPHKFFEKHESANRNLDIRVARELIHALTTDQPLQSIVQRIDHIKALQQQKTSKTLGPLSPQLTNIIEQGLAAEVTSSKIKK